MTTEQERLYGDKKEMYRDIVHKRTLIAMAVERTCDDLTNAIVALSHGEHGRLCSFFGTGCAEVIREMKEDRIQCRGHTSAVMKGLEAMHRYQQNNSISEDLAVVITAFRILASTHEPRKS